MSEEKISLHPRNKHRFRYDFPVLIKSLADLGDFVYLNPYGDQSIDFSDPKAVRMLNKALLKHFYGITHWDIPDGYLCPPIPGRADYLHYIADLLASSNDGQIPKGKSVKALDIGLGANCIYPIIGHQEYGWNFVGSDVDAVAVKTAEAIAAANPAISGGIRIRHQRNKQQIFKGIVKPGEYYDFTLCNPPFHSSAEDARSGSARKLKNLGKNTAKPAILNFGGRDTELWYPGGEVAFIRNMVMESKEFAKQCMWFSSLVSKSQHLPFITTMLRDGVGVYQFKVIEMSQGQKISRFVAWTFLSTQERYLWSQRWRM